MKTSSCLICEAEMIDHSETRQLRCFICSRKYQVSATCTDEHYVCEDCESYSAAEYIRQYCILSESTDPVSMATEIMHNPRIPMHGPEHHLIISEVLLASIYNKRGQPQMKKKMLPVAESRAKQLPEGACGYFGDCGGAVSTGIVVSILTGASPQSVAGWKEANLMTARSLTTIANHGAPRCCKRATWLALSEAVTYMKDVFSDELTLSLPVCGFWSGNQTCMTEECLYYPS